MQLVDYLDKGAALGPDAPCLTMGDRALSYAEVQSLTHRVARSLARDGIAPGSHVAVLSENDPVAFACVFPMVIGTYSAVRAVNRHLVWSARSIAHS